MADAIVNDLLDLMPDELLAQPVALDAYGDWVASGAELAVPCYVEGNNQLIRDAAGREVVSSVQAYCGGAFGLSAEGYRYTLPARFTPRENLTAVSVGKVSDENGAHHETVFLP